MRGIRRAVIALVAVMVLPLAGSGQARIAAENFEAVLTNISNVGRTGLTPINITIDRFTPDEVSGRLLKILADDGQESFLRELLNQKPVGWIATPTSLRYDFFFAQSFPAAEGGRRIILITDRPMQIWERMSGATSRDYPFTVVELHLDTDGRGNGTLAQLAQLRLSGDVLGIENLATSPMRLTEVKKVK